MHGVWAVTPVAVGPLLQHEAHFFNLQHTRIRFAPRSATAYDVRVSAYAGVIDRGVPLAKAPDSRNQGHRIPLPFSFPFGGRNWSEAYINVNGAIAFGEPTVTNNPQPDSWPDGTMRSMASLFDVRAITGKRWTIVPFWGRNSSEATHIFTRSSGGTFIVTWQAVRYQGINDGYAPLGENTFQVRLSRDGSIEFRYGDIAEKDGIVGVFCGSAARGTLLDHVHLPPAGNLDPAVDLRRAEVEDRGVDVLFRLTFAAPIHAKTVNGVIWYGVAAVSQGEANVIRMTVDSTGARSDPLCEAVNPHDRMVAMDCTARTVAVASGRTIELTLPKIALKNPSSLRWRAEVATDQSPKPPSSTGGLRHVPLDPAMVSGFGFKEGRHVSAGNIYEIFYYPFVPKARTLAFQEIYKHVPAEDDLAIVLTDFRIDDIHDHGSSISAGAGEDSNSREMFNSAMLQQAAGPVYLGPRFREVIQQGGRTFRHYNFAVAWAAHEMTHRWVATLKWKSDNPTALLDTVQPGHWSPLLYTPAVTPVSPYFADPAYPEESIMGGMTIQKLPDGSMQSVLTPFGAVSGLCALDLYSMGLIGRDEVPDTFFIGGAKSGPDGNLVGGDPVPVTIADIIAANGPRVPPAKDAQHRFKFQIYLLHENGRDVDPAKLAQARGVEAAIIEYFKLATNGRMTVAPTR